MLPMRMLSIHCVLTKIDGGVPFVMDPYSSLPQCFVDDVGHLHNRLFDPISPKFIYMSCFCVPTFITIGMLFRKQTIMSLKKEIQ